MSARGQRQQDRVGFGLLAAQVAMAAARRRDGLPLDGGELELLEEASGLFRALAARVRMVATPGQSAGPRPLVPVSVVNDIVFGGETELPTDRVIDRYEALGRQLDQLAQKSLAIDVVTEMVGTFRGFAERARSLPRSPALRLQ